MTVDVFGIVGSKQAGVFRVERVVAEGGYAVVYRAQHEGFRAPVALKCLKVPEAMTPDQREVFLERFREEGEMLFRLSALVPAVVRPLHVDVLTLDDGRIVPFLALEWLDGEGLDELIDHRRVEGKPPIELRALVALLRPVAQALAQAHRLPGPDGPLAIIHRDLKPENLFVTRTPDGQAVKILDFGIARTKSAASLSAGRATESVSLDAFTPGYAAPEQWMPRHYGQVGPWTDVFGFALCMVEVLTGKPVVEGDLRAALGTAIDPKRRPTPRNEGATVSDEVEAAFARALAVDPRARTQSVEAFWTELETALGEPPSMRPSGPSSVRRDILLASERRPPVQTSPATVTVEARLSLSPSKRPVGMVPPVDSPFEVNPTPEPARVPFDLAAPPRPRPVSELATQWPASQPRDSGLSSLGAALRGPLWLVVTAILLSGTDWIYTRHTGELFHIGTVRPVWIAGPLALIGVGLACWRLIAAM